jgi:hypothetical protein
MIKHLRTMIGLKEEMIELQMEVLKSREKEIARLEEELDHLMCVTIPVLRKSLCGRKDQPDNARRSTAALVLVKSCQSRQG